MSLLLTGAAGFIGREFPNYYNGKLIRKVIRTSADFVDDNYIIKKIDGDTEWGDTFDGVEAIIHLAGLAHSKRHSSDLLYNVNVLGTLKLARDAAAYGVKRFVFVSSIGVNGACSQSEPFTSHMEPKPHNEYSRTKYEAEQGLKKISEETGLELVIIRPTLVYGANPPGNFRALLHLIQSVPLLPFGMTNNKRDFIAVQNLVDLLLVSSHHPNAAGHIFLASDGKSVSTKEFTTAVAWGLNKKVYQLPIPPFIMKVVARLFGKSTLAEQLLGNLQVNSAPLGNVLGWIPPYTMAEAMSHLLEFKE
ncbi:NAD-dependent epimerase/dehydratase family protein [Pseudoalteromonas gelatinilytica]